MGDDLKERYLPDVMRRAATNARDEPELSGPARVLLAHYLEEGADRIAELEAEVERLRTKMQDMMDFIEMALNEDARSPNNRKEPEDADKG